MLTQRQLQSYWADGFIVLPELIDKTAIAEMRRVTDRFVEESRNVSQHTDVFDLEPDHSSERPRLRRLKNPHKLHDSYRNVLWHEGITSVMRQILGDSFRLHGGVQKINMKLAGDGAPVNWHQDWAFYPHTNDDMLALGIFLDDVDETNGPMLAIPGSHRGPIHDHTSDGTFCGAIDPHQAGIDVADAVSMTGPAGTVTFHHVRLVHGSVSNRSERDRRLLIYEVAAADAWPLSGTYMSPLTTQEQLDEWNRWMICGKPSYQARMEPVPVRLPLPFPSTGGSVYEIQNAFKGGIDQQHAASQAT